MRIMDADRGDLGEILALQYAAYRTEADLFGGRDIPPLRQTLDEVVAEYESGIILKLVDDDGAIIGSVRAAERDGTAYIGKLMVREDRRRRGYGARLLAAIEKRFPGRRYELFTSTRSVDNIRLYKNQGYDVFDEKSVEDGLRFVYMEKGPA